jgi:hypothetical protein
MTFLLLKDYDHYTIVNDDADFSVGRVYPLRGQESPYRVFSSFSPGYQRDPIAIVKSLDEAIPAFLAYYKKNPVQWGLRKASFVLAPHYVCGVTGRAGSTGALVSLSG